MRVNFFVFHFYKPDVITKKMKEQYSVEEILNAVEEFQTVKQKTVSTNIKNEKQKKYQLYQLIHSN